MMCVETKLEDNLNVCSDGKGERTPKVVASGGQVRKQRERKVKTVADV